ncbi:MAG TPA: DUF2339 domain-containing protein [Mucilaginibacter sp.]|nr:DUF2339 domain-containing protein [Mucilaginibacter sp.]
MDLLNLILLATIIAIIVTSKASINQKLSALEQRISDLQNQLHKYQQKPTQTVSEAAPEVKPPKKHEPIPVETPPESTKPEKIAPDIVVEKHAEVITDLSSVRRPVKTTEQKKQTETERSPSFFERYPDLEKFIGENLVNKIGIAILVLAIGFFVKYAIDNNWVGAVGRIGIGIVCGGILTVFAHRMRNSYRAFSSVLAGGGLAIFYFTITLAFQDFHLFSQITALAILIVITLFAVVLSLLYNKQELAVIALIGGFASPFMVSNGSANYTGLFVYLLVLNTGLLIIAWYKAWRILNISAFALSVIVFGTVLLTLKPANYTIGFRFASAFYLLFFVINIINNVRENKKFLAADFSILLLNTALYFAAGLYLLNAMHLPQYKGIFSASLAALNLFLSYILFRNRRVDPNILYLLIGITLTFISLTAPIQLHGHYITMFWASETILLYWLYQKSGIKLMKLTSLIIWMAMFVSLFMDICQIYFQPGRQLPIIVNKGFITTVFSAVSTYILYVLVRRDDQSAIYGVSINKTLYRVVALVLLFLAGALEIVFQFSYYYPHSGLDISYLICYTTIFVLLFNSLSAKINHGEHSHVVSASLSAIAILLYLLLSPLSFQLLEMILVGKKISAAHFTAHWASAVFISVILFRLVIACCQLNESLKKMTAWILSSVIVIFLSLEFCLLSELIFYSPENSVDIIQTVYVKTALPVLWGLVSFTLMWLGMRNKQKTLRIISLNLFSVTLLKLFLFDIKNIPVAGKIAAFFCLGVLLLIISFMYQKVKKIIVDDETDQKN